MKLVVLKNMLLLCVATLVAFVAVEGALRFTEFRYLMLPRYSVWPQGYFRRDPELGAVHARNHPADEFVFKGGRHPIFTNKLGCFDREYVGERPYILAVGDSSTWGYGALEDKWTTYLEQRSGLRILKCGVSSTGPKYQSIWAKRIIKDVGTPPLMVIVLYDTWNDFNDDVGFPNNTAIDGRRFSSVKTLDLRNGYIERYRDEEIIQNFQSRLDDRWTFGESIRANFVTFALLERTLRPYVRSYVEDTARHAGPVLQSLYEVYLWNVDSREYPWVEIAFREHVANMLAFAEYVKSIGAEFVLLTVNLPETGLQGELQRAVRQELPHVYDVGEYISEMMGDRRVYYRFNNHWNREGNEAAGKGIYEYLRREGLIPAQ